MSDIALNSISKFKVRVLPSLLEYVAIHNKIPNNLTFAFACLIRFYKGTWQGKSLPIKDSEDIISFFTKVWNLNEYGIIAKTVLENENFWDQDLTKIASLTQAIEIALREIDENGIENGFINFTKQF